jgi:hypothetical protein
MSQLRSLQRSYKFNATTFNKNFENKMKQNKSKSKIKQINEIHTEQPQLIHTEQINEIHIDESNKIIYSKSMTDNLGINMKNLFFEILEMLLNKNNPIPYILQDDNKQFTFAIMIIILGGLLLFLSNLMINPT